jgi:hypothetical protein
MEKVLPFFNKFPPGFQEAFITVFGINIRDERDVIILTKDFCDLKWGKVNNGRVITLDDIYLVRGDEIVLESESNEHHWPPKSVGGELTVSVSMEFHIAWHIIFMNLSRDREFKRYLNILFHNKEVDDFKSFIKLLMKFEQV